MTTQQQNKNEFLNQIIDYRNGRYQGSADIYSRKPNGKGMFLDQNYLFVLSDWIDGYPSSKTVAIYPNKHMFYGNLLNNKPNKLCAYKQPEKYTIYFKNFISQNHIAIIDDYQSQSLLIIYVNYKEWLKFTKSQRKNKVIFVQKQTKVNKLIQVVSHQVYICQQQKWKIIQQYFKEKVETQYKNYSTFIKSSYESNKQPKIFARENNTEYQLGYEGSSIVCKIEKNIKMQQDYTIKLMGIYDESQQIFQIYKRSKGNDKTQEYIKGISSITYLQRPKSCTNHLRQFYKKSTIFCNSFVNTNIINQLQLFFTAISHYVDYFLTNKYAETFIYKPKNEDQITSAISNTGKESHISKAKENNQQSKKCKINEKQSNCQSLYQNQSQIHSKVRVFNHHSNIHITNQNQIKKEKHKERKINVKPLTEINFCISSSLNLLSTDLKSLTQHLYEIQQEIKKSNHQTPPKSCKNSINPFSHIKQIPSPKLNLSVHSCKTAPKQSNISSSQSKLKKQGRIIWR